MQERRAPDNIVSTVRVMSGCFLRISCGFSLDFRNYMLLVMCLHNYTDVSMCLLSEYEFGSLAPFRYFLFGGRADMPF